jgi:hypothetical protein
MLRDKDRMPAPRRLLTVIPRLTGSQPLLDELGCVHEDRVQSLSREIASVLVVERLPGAKRALPECRKQLVYVPHPGILRDRRLGREGARSRSPSGRLVTVRAACRHSPGAAYRRQFSAPPGTRTALHSALRFNEWFGGARSTTRLDREGSINVLGPHLPSMRPRAYSSWCLLS